MICFPDSAVLHLPKVHFDHHPLLVLNGAYNNSCLESPFKFLNAWATHDTFSNLVRESWNKEANIFRECSNFANKAKKWNKEIFGNVYKKKECASGRIECYPETIRSQLLREFSQS